MTIAGGVHPVWYMPDELAKKERGIKLAASAHHTDLRIAREIAKELARDGREVCADDVRAVLAERHPDIDGNMNWMGALFRERDSWGPIWEPAGFVRSVTAGSHGNRILRWRLR